MKQHNQNNQLGSVDFHKKKSIEQWKHNTQIRKNTKNGIFSLWNSFIQLLHRKHNLLKQSKHFIFPTSSEKPRIKIIKSYRNSAELHKQYQRESEG